MFKIWECWLLWLNQKQAYFKLSTEVKDHFGVRNIKSTKFGARTGWVHAILSTAFLVKTLSGLFMWCQCITHVSHYKHAFLTCITQLSVFKHSIRHHAHVTEIILFNILCYCTSNPHDCLWISRLESDVVFTWDLIHLSSERLKLRLKQHHKRFFYVTQHLFYQLNHRVTQRKRVSPTLIAMLHILQMKRSLDVWFVLSLKSPGFL